MIPVIDPMTDLTDTMTDIDNAMTDLTDTTTDMMNDMYNSMPDYGNPISSSKNLPDYKYPFVNAPSEKGVFDETYGTMRWMSCKFEVVESFGIVQMLLADNAMDIYGGAAFNFDVDFGVTIETNNVNSTVVEAVVPFQLTIPYELFNSGSGGQGDSMTEEAINYADEFNFDAVKPTLEDLTGAGTYTYMDTTGLDTSVTAGLMNPPTGTDAPPMFYIAYQNIYEEAQNFLGFANWF